MGGYKEIVAEIKGRGAFAKLKFESGVHRVQRVPDTEASGRIHTSAATVAVLPEAEEVDVTINEADLKIDTLRAGGAGGQHVNKTESAIRITHLPTGIVVMMQEDRSQHRNRAKAMAVLRTRLYDHERQKLDSARAAARRGQVGSGDRSERIRTYNFPQGRVSDHRINLTLYKLPQILEGEALGEIIDALVHRASGRVAGGGGRVSSTAASVAQARRALAAQFRAAGLDYARARRAHPGRPRARARSHGAGGRGGAAACRRAPQPQIARFAARRLAGEPVARIVGDEGILGAAADRHARRAGAAAGDRNGGRARARAASIGGARARARCASPISAPARARSCSHCCASCRTPSASAPTSTRRRSRSRGAMRKRLGLAARAHVPRERLRQRAARPVRSRRVEPALHRDAATSRRSRREVRDHDPPHALDGGADGLAAYRAIAADAPRLLAPGGRLVVEIGAGQQRDVERTARPRGGLQSPPSGTTCRVIARAIAAHSPGRIGDITEAAIPKAKKPLGMSQKTD